MKFSRRSGDTPAGRDATYAGSIQGPYPRRMTGADWAELTIAALLVIFVIAVATGLIP